MFKVKVITIGKLKEKWLVTALKEYEKRLKGSVEIEWLLLKNERDLYSCVENCTFIALDPNGTLLTSEAFSKKLFQLGLRINFLIGGPNGLSKTLLKKALFVWSLSPLTFTHQMTRLIFVEQLYRGIEIEKGSKYHK